METQEDFMKRRAKSWADAAREADADLLVKVAFEKPAPIPHMPSPMQPGFLLRRQAL